MTRQNVKLWKRPITDVIIIRSKFNGSSVLSPLAPLMREKLFKQSLFIVLRARKTFKDYSAKTVLTAKTLPACKKGLARRRIKTLLAFLHRCEGKIEAQVSGEKRRESLRSLRT